jgi:hypothetical protein
MPPRVHRQGQGQCTPYEFGVKVSIVTTNARAPGGRFVLHAMAPARQAAHAVYYRRRRARLRLENARRSYRSSLASLPFKSVMSPGAAVSAK